MPKVPPHVQQEYNQTLPGVYGEFGSGDHTTVLYLQTALRPTDLSKTTLISEIRGSETWPVPDLFQREVDEYRVAHSLLPYLVDTSKVKFFSPITLTVLPNNEAGEVLTALPVVEEREEIENSDGNEVVWVVVEMPGYYRYKRLRGAPEAWAYLQWNDKTVRLVAIDGQHRLSALKRWQGDPQRAPDLASWSIPAVVLAFRGDGHKAQKKSILDIVRSIFMYVNTKAIPPNRCRSILLSDESANAICTQELLQLSHGNDVLPDKDRDEAVVPLLCFDWRGAEEDGKPIPSPAALKGIEEIEAWFANYVLGEDFTDKQAAALGVNPTDSLQTAFATHKLNSEAARELRTRVRDDVVKAVARLLQAFTPYREYIAELRRIEKEYAEKSVLAHHALYDLRFGSNNGGDAQQQGIARDKQLLVEEIRVAMGKTIRGPIALDIGMRGVLSAFGEVRAVLSASKKKTVGWVDYADVFVGLLNAVYADGWLDPGTSKEVRDVLRHVIQDHAGDVVNYRLDQAQEAFGAYVALCVCAYAFKKKVISAEVWERKREDLCEVLGETVMKGYRKEVRPALREEYPNGGKLLTAAVNKEAEKKAAAHLKKLDNVLAKILG